MVDLFSDFFDGFDIYPVYHETAKCPHCGRSFAEFQKSSLLGCPECYKAFDAPLQATIKQIHQNPTHVGKVPARCGGALRQKRRYETLKREISQAVAAEDYEKAAKLHKELKEMGGEQ